MEVATSSKPVKRLGVIGSGLMGTGIAQVAVTAGLMVDLYDEAPQALDRARESIASGLARDVVKGRLTEDQREAAMSRLRTAGAVEDLIEVDAVIEAVIERTDIKRDLFARLDAMLPAPTLLASNTSAIPITDIAAAASRPERIIGMHFFSPVPSMQLCEIVRGYATDDIATAAAQVLASVLGKQTILVQRDDAGFVTSRLLTALIQEAARVVEEGVATAEDVDRACVLGFGHRMGPLETADLTGIDVAYRAGLAIYEGSGREAFFPPQILRRMVTAGDLGRKSGRGFYDHSGGVV